MLCYDTHCKQHTYIFNQEVTLKHVNILMFAGWQTYKLHNMFSIVSMLTYLMLHAKCRDANRYTLKSNLAAENLVLLTSSGLTWDVVM